MQALFEHGPAAMWRNQPTASAFLAIWVIATVVTALVELATDSSSARRQTVSFAWLAIALGAVTNLVYQLAQ